MRTLLEFVGKKGGNMDSKEKRADRFYQSFLAYTESLFNEFSAKKELDFQSIQRKIKLLYEFVRLDCNSIIYVMQTAERYKNPHVSHSVRSSIIAIIIGICLKLPRHQLIELGVADLLCNIGALNLSGRIYTKSEGALNLMKKSLTPF